MSFVLENVSFAFFTLVLFNDVFTYEFLCFTFCKKYLIASFLLISRLHHTDCYLFSLYFFVEYFSIFVELSFFAMESHRQWIASAVLKDEDQSYM